MTAATLIFAADSYGNFIDPETGASWNIPEDREFFRWTIAGKCIICGRITFLKDWKGLLGADTVIALTHKRNGDVVRQVEAVKKEMEERPGKRFIDITHSLPAALFIAKDTNPEEIFIVGGEKTIKAFAPFASRIISTQIFTTYRLGAPRPDMWLPDNCLPYGWVTNSQKLWMRNKDSGAEKTGGSDYVRYDIRRAVPINF